MGTLREDLGAGREVRETHISLVFMDRDAVWKVKKPVDFGFLNFTTLERRRAACEAEVQLNRRLASDVYRGVVPVWRGSDGRHHLGPEQPGDELVEWAVSMRRLSDEARADQLLRSGRLSSEHVRQLAEHLARFHAAAHADATLARFGKVEGIRHNVQENFEQTRAALPDYLSPAEAGELQQRQLGFLEQHAGWLEQRAAEGYIRDCHGDLRLEHVYFEPTIQIIDCIEFNDRFRYGDTCSDLAFLAMDLTHHERQDLAELLVARYAQAAGDYSLFRVLDFYAGYRAMVRAKVTILSQPAPAHPDVRQSRRGSQARRYLLQALASQRRFVFPQQVIAVGGLIASGKSTVATTLSQVLHCPVVDSDRTRKALHGVSPTQRLAQGAFDGAYSEETTSRVYEAIFERAAHVLQSGRSVIIDASFRRGEQRARCAELATRYDIPFTFIECRVPRETAIERLERRARGPSISDGDMQVYDRFAATWEPVEELAPEAHLRLTTDQPMAVIQQLLQERFVPEVH